MRAALAAKAQNVQQLRRLVPARYVPVVVRQRLKKHWANPEFRAHHEEQMRFLLEYSERADEIPQLAYAYAEQMMLRSFMRWHPRAITRQRVSGAEWLTTRRDPNRSIVVSFMHHHRYEAMWPSLSRYGIKCHVLITPEMVGPNASVEFKQHYRVGVRGAIPVTTAGGTAAIADVMRPGVMFGMASDFPGHTPITFLGRKVLASFGAARIAAMTDSQVVLITHERDAEGPYLQIHPPMEPKDFADPADLLTEIMRRHEGPILAWPEALESPHARWKPVG